MTRREWLLQQDDDLCRKILASEDADEIAALEEDKAFIEMCLMSETSQ